MSEFSHPGCGYSPHPQFSRVTPEEAGGALSALAPSWVMSRLAYPKLAEQPPNHDARIEVLLSECARSS
jgi:hypothetical protein